MSLQSKWEDLSEEQKAKVRGCATPEELISLAQEDGYELSDDELEAVAGGSFWTCDDHVPCYEHQSICDRGSS